MRLSKRRATAAVILSVAAVVCVCMFSEPIETVREGLTMPDSDSSLDDEELMAVLYRDAAVAGAHSLVNTGNLAASLRAKDVKFQVQLQELLAKEQTSRQKYFATKVALMSKVASSKHDCKKKFAVQMEQQDKPYLARFSELLAQPNIGKAKANLKLRMQRLQLRLQAALRGQSGAAAVQIKNEYSAQFLALKKTSPYYLAIEKLRIASHWYPQYNAKVAAHVTQCSRQIQAQASTALKLLQGKSKWFSRYSELIRHSEWFSEFHAHKSAARGLTDTTGQQRRSVAKPALSEMESLTPIHDDTLPPSLLGLDLSAGDAVDDHADGCAVKDHNSHFKEVAHSLRADDKEYAAAYKALLEKDKQGREKFLAAKKSLEAIASSAMSSCQKKLAMDMEHGDSAYTAAYKALMSNPDTATAKTQLQQHMTALQKQYTTEIQGKTAAAAADIKTVFETRFKSAKESSSYYNQVQHLREASNWYPEYKAKLPDYLPSCKAKKQSDVDTAIVLLEHKSQWFKDYSALIKASAWYHKYDEQVRAELLRCRQGKLMPPPPPVPTTPVPTQQPTEHPTKEGHQSSSATTPVQSSKVTTTTVKDALKAAGAYHSAAAPPPTHSDKGSYSSTSSHENSQESYSSEEETLPTAPPVPAPVPPVVEKDKVAEALRDAQDALAGANTTAEESAAHDAVDDALKAAGVKDASDAGAVAVAQHQLDLAKAWAEGVLDHQANALDRVGAWQSGARKDGEEQRRVVESVIQTMIAVAHATENQELVAQERQDRDRAKLKGLDAPMKQAREAAVDAQKSVAHAKAALAATLGTKARIEAKKSLAGAEAALHDANTILATEVDRKQALEAVRLQKDKAKLTGESEIHYQSRKTYHHAQRMLKLVNGALEAVRKAHYEHKQAELKRQQEAIKEKASKLTHKEKEKKSEENWKRRKIKSREEYAATLASEALDAGEKAEAYMKQAAKAGRAAAEKIMAAAEVKADLYKEQHPQTASKSAVAVSVAKESAAAILAEQASSMEHAALRGRQGSVRNTASLMGLEAQVGTHVSEEALQRAEQTTANAMPSDRDIEHWRSESGLWKQYYKKLYSAKFVQAKKKKAKMDQIVNAELKRESLAHGDTDTDDLETGNDPLLDEPLDIDVDANARVQ